MEDFKNSVAHLDVSVKTEITYEAVVGENFYRFLYVSQKTGFKPTLLTKDTYVDTLNELLNDDADNLELAKKNISSIYEYASDARGYIISAEDYVNYKYKGYFVYAEAEYNAATEQQYEEATIAPTADPKALGLYEETASGYALTEDETVQSTTLYEEVAPSGTENPSVEGWYESDGAGGYVVSADTSVDDSKTYYRRVITYKKYYEAVTVTTGYNLATASKAVLDTLEENWDKAFSQLLLDIAVPYTIKAEDELTTALLAVLNKYTMPISWFPRGAEENLAWKGENVDVGLSPALYQLGRTLSFTNVSGTPVGNSCDTVQVAQQDVLVTRSTGTDEIKNPDAIVIAWFEKNRLQYFKTVGNGTGALSLYGGWDCKNGCVCANWIVAYVNYMVKVATAELVTLMNTFKSAKVYKKILVAMNKVVKPFIQLERIVNYEETAPQYSNLPKTNGHTITIPDAWKGLYQDNLRKVNVQGELTVQA